MKKYIPSPSKREYLTFVFLFIELIIFSILAPNFLSIDNFMRVIQNNAEIAIVSIGMTIVMLLGGIDLSVGSIMGVVAILIGYMLNSDINIMIIFIISITVGVALGVVNGFFVAYFKIPDILVTLATSNIWRAAIFALLGGKWLTGLKPGYASFLKQKLLGIPMILILLIIVYGVFYYMLMYRKYGRYVYASGNNEHGAELSGINVKRVKMISYGISGGIATIASLLYVARMGSVEMTVGNELAISCIAAVTIGGIGAKGAGKRGSIIGTFAGVLFIAFLRNGTVILGVPSLLENFFIGLLIILSVLFDSLMRLKSSAKGKEIVQ